MTFPISSSRRQGLMALGLAAAGAAMGAATASAQVPASRPLAGRGAIVSGARNNLGRAFAVALAGLGAGVVVHHHRPASRAEAEETARLVTAAGGRAVIVQGDLGEARNVRAMYDAAEAAFGGIDIVVNNAGAIIKKPLAEFTDEEFERLDAINNRALFYSLREAGRRMRDGGRIINIGTSLLAGSAPGYTIYAGTKAPVEEYSRMMARELSGRRITVNTVAPGPIDTPFFHGQETPASVAFATNLAVERRLGRVEDVVPLVTFLARPDSEWVNGQTLWINGGYVTR
jgi:NAD(P)-dependent dehydrogenase (short-subunit alcohol dehydrogenase family)